MHNPTPMDPSYYDKFSLTYHFGELVLSPTSYTSKFCSSHPNEVWVKGFFFMVPHEEHGHSISSFDDGIIIAPYYLHLQHHRTWDITSSWSIIIGHGILTYVIGADLTGHLKHYVLGKW